MKPFALWAFRGRVAVPSILAAVFMFANVAFGGDGGGVNNDPAYLLTSAVQAGDFDRLEERIAEVAARLPADDKLRLHLMNRMAGLGKYAAENAVATLESYAGDYDADGESVRVLFVARINQYYLHRPEVAAAAFESVAPNLVTSNFLLHATSRELFSVEKLERLLEQIVEKSPSPTIPLPYEAILLAAKGETEEARSRLEQYDNSVPRHVNSCPMLLPSAVAHGWLGDELSVVEILTPCLAFMSQNHGPEGFRLYCGWLRDAIAFDPIRNGEVLEKMWGVFDNFTPRTQRAPKLE